MEKKLITIKEVVRIGSGAHIILPKKYLGKEVEVYIKNEN